MSKKKVIVIGGGASGIVAAIAASRSGADVTILEHMKRIGKKILSTGNGKCNITNLNQDIKKYNGNNPEFILPVFEQFGVKETLDFFHAMGILIKDKNGYIYPNSEQASSVLDVLRMELENLNVEIICECKINGIKKIRNQFIINTNLKEYKSDACIMAIGGKAAPVTGSDGSGFLYVKEFGHTVLSMVPALVQLKAKQSFFKELAGIRIEGNVQLWSNSMLLASEYGEIQLTKYGISGIPVMQISRFASLELLKYKKVSAILDFNPQMNEEELKHYLKNRFKHSRNKTAEECFIGFINKKLGNVLLKESGINLNQNANGIKFEQIEVLVKKIKTFSIDIIAANSFENAQVTAGGISTTEINNKTLESKLVSQLFFAGEMIDIDGTCGGYNLQWAWSSGYVAGIHAAMRD
ncbi:BaiN/RdsA family NAD(P)/FAD-dependent oxidoreductase [Anaerosacchariphilus polymeriproducens]|uniref:NAD(P)/FAD-dependent oxidoreductase n=1 Tax=Anaerosacchariphilus polymeriproducens TaxID=1812858 RepID=A0A371AU28_9FIRM|nr:NAD(P)/FAD-dependent oxidoreductase [Anaerosacchariphilus polymeriproducens]RDU23071.1 NAD(P)/FAD-dependent oxidoreductase [Anaerosacchariphilus polymeriproducens]